MVRERSWSSGIVGRVSVTATSSACVWPERRKEKASSLKFLTASGPQGTPGTAMRCLLLLALQVMVLLVKGSQASRASHLSPQEERIGGRYAGPVQDLESYAQGDDYYRNGITFQVFTRQNPTEPELMDIYNLNKPKLQYFDPRRPTKVINHGWRSDGKGEEQIKSAFFATMDVNVILVNWTSIDSAYYPVSRSHVPHIAESVADLLDFLSEVYEVPASSLHLLGQSLGAHISGLAAKRLPPGTVGRITGLDPAGPMFFKNNPAERLDKSDAAFVDVIHTCANILGFKDPIGHVDFFPNGGTCSQPGCLLSDLKTLGICSHNRAFDFMEESILKRDSFKAYPCNWWKKPDRRDPSKAIIMGYDVPVSARGSYCLKTRSHSPYAVDNGKEDRSS